MAVDDTWAELQPTEIPLWDGDAPGSEGAQQREGEGLTDYGLRVVRNVVRPTLTPFIPDKPTGTAVVVAPGGAFHFLAWDHEGIEVARWLSARGIAAFILKYRLIATDDTFPADMNARMRGGDHEAWIGPVVPLIRADALQAIRVVRSRATEWSIDPHRVGIMGFSAGGTVTSLATLHYDAGSRPDFAAPIYGAGAPGGVPADAPPLFIAVANDDDLLPHSLEMGQRWRDAGREVELHVYARGGHGFGMNRRGLPCDTWIERFHDWLAMLGC
jgi:acetyl esterase/lipase